jgi:dTDP-glucose 4,6-dehydratase
MNILVTGGCGFLGTNLCPYLQAKGHKVLSVDKLTYAAVLPPKAPNVVLDVCDTPQLARIVSGFHPNWVIHAAAESHVDNSISDPDLFVHSNYIGTHSVLKVLLHQPTPVRAKLLYVSTDEVYGDRLNKDAATESTAFAASSPYSASKAAADLLVQAYGRTYGLPYSIIRMSNLYGPWQHREKLIPTVLSRLLAHQMVPIYGDGTQQRQWLHVQDACSKIEALLQYGIRGAMLPMIVNCPGPSLLSNMAVYNLLCEVSKLSGQWESVPDRPGHDWIYSMQSQPDTHTYRLFRDGITEGVVWYLSPEGRAFLDACRTA